MPKLRQYVGLDAPRPALARLIGLGTGTVHSSSARWRLLPEKHGTQEYVEAMPVVCATGCNPAPRPAKNRDADPASASLF
jgi:hypothetical protein